MMTFPYIPSSIAGDMAPLFRMMDRPLHPRARRWAQPPRHLAAPRFDVRERNAAFELQGELPGLQQEDVTIEFVDRHTLVIRGRVEREETVTNMKDGEGFAQLSGRDQSVDASADGVQDGDKPATTAVNAEKVDAGIDGNNGLDEGKKTEESEDGEKYKYWVSERVVGGFERHFKFPSDVDQEAVKASLKNGILSVMVPKIVKRQKKTIVVQGE